jgi:hypothetical protein
LVGLWCGYAVDRTAVSPGVQPVVCVPLFYRSEELIR